MTDSIGKIVVVDDDRDMCNYLQLVLQRHGYEAYCHLNAADAFEAVRAEPCDAVITDLNMPGMSGVELCERVCVNHPDVPVIVLTAFGRLDTAVAAMRAGAYDFLTKPIDAQVVLYALRRAVQHHRLRQEVQRLRQAPRPAPRFSTLIGESAPMRELYELVERIAQVDSAVLIRGETGSGKELVARALHAASPRRSAPFVAVNCAAMPEALLESELFGHVRGAFSGAASDNPGLFQRAHAGTLFLDEIGDMTPTLQAKLLRALQDGLVRPVGAADERRIDVRIVAATHHDLEAAVRDGRFREDLLFRLNVIPIEVPPLRARGSDVLLLAQDAIDRQAERMKKHVLGLTPAAATRLLQYSWPGNVRELQNSIERAVVLTTTERLLVEDLPPGVRDYSTDAVQFGVEAADPAQLPSLAEVERRYVLRVIDAVGGNKALAARTLGIERRTLYRMLERYAVAPSGRGTDEDTDSEGLPD